MAGGLWLETRGMGGFEWWKRHVGPKARQNSTVRTPSTSLLWNDDFLNIECHALTRGQLWHCIGLPVAICDVALPKLYSVFFFTFAVGLEALMVFPLQIASSFPVVCWLPFFYCPE